MSILNEESVTNIIKDIDCVQETQQHFVNIEHSWSIKDICDLVSSKRPGEKIESEQFSYDEISQEKLCNEFEEKSQCAEGSSKLSILPSSYSLDFELACDYLINNTLWRLEIDKSPSDSSFVSVNALLLGNTKTTSIEPEVLNSIEQLSNSDYELIFKINFYFLNDKMNDIFDKNTLEIKINLKKCLQQLTLRHSDPKNNFLIDQYQIENFFKIKNFLIWLNNRKSDDFCLITDFKLYRKSKNNETKLKHKLKASSLLILDFKHAWTIKNWRNFLMPVSTSHTFLNDYDINNMFSSTDSKLLNEFGEEFEASSSPPEIERIKFGKFRSKLFSLIQQQQQKDPLEHNCAVNRINSLLKDVKWKLQLYPNGYSQEYENNLSLFVNFSQLTGDLSQFTPNTSKNKTLNSSIFSTNNKSIEETFYDSSDDYGLILLIKSPPSGQQTESDPGPDDRGLKARKKANFLETFVKASFQISIFDSNGKKVDKCQSEKQLFELFGSWGYKEYMNARDLIDLKEKYLSDNNTTLNLNCKIVLFYTVTTKMPGSSFLDMPFVIKNDKLEIKDLVSSNSEHSSSSENLETKETVVHDKPKNLRKKRSNGNQVNSCNTLVYDLRRLFLKSEMSNLTIQAPVRISEDMSDKESNIKEFKVHKLILSSRSEVFEKMFSVENDSNHLNTLCICDFDAFTVEIFLNYLYTDILEINLKNFKFNSTESNCKYDEDSEEKSSDDEINECKDVRLELCTHIFVELFKISDKYCVHRLKQICENQLIKMINVDNTVELLVVSYLHNSNKLKKKCFNFLAENISNIISQTSWAQLEKNYPALLAESFRVLYFKKREKL